MNDVEKSFVVQNSIADFKKAYLEIKPENDMSENEVSDFINSEFEKAHNESDEYLYGLLLSEVFGRSESEINIDFKMSDRIASILENFQHGKWQDLDDDERIMIIKDYADEIGKGLGLDRIPNIEISDENEPQGSYDYETNTITINRKDIDNPYEIVDTIPHELRHAYQHMRAEIMDTYEDILYKINFDNYLTPKQLMDGSWLFFTDYYDQYVEVDARAFAKIFTETLK